MKKTLTPNQHWRLGGGVRLVTGPELKGRDSGYAVSTKFKSSVGAIAEAEYLFTNWFGLKPRAVGAK